jgi:hypothetical protein
VAEAGLLAARVTALPPGARRSGLLGALDLLADRPAAAEAKLLEAWRAHDRRREGPAGAAAALRLVPLCMNAGRTPEAIEWALRAARADAAPAALHRRALGMLALAWPSTGARRRGWPGWISWPLPHPRWRGKTPTP